MQRKILNVDDWIKTKDDRLFVAIYGTKDWTIEFAKRISDNHIFKLCQEVSLKRDVVTWEILEFQENHRDVRIQDLWGNRLTVTIDKIEHVK